MTQEQMIEQINGIQDGQHVSVTIPMGGSNVEVSGTASVDSSGNVTIAVDPGTEISGVVAQDVKITIPRGNGVTAETGFEATLSGKVSAGTIGDIPINGTKISVSDNKVTVTGSPYGALDGTHDLPAGEQQQGEQQQ